MGLLSKLFRGRAQDDQPTDAPDSAAPFHESESTEGGVAGRSGPRRELVHTVLREAMRLHGIPSDWLECRILTAVTRSGATGVHVQLAIRQAQDRMLPYVLAFQQSFLDELRRAEPRINDWLISIAWEFDAAGGGSFGAQAAAAGAHAAGLPAAVAQAAPAAPAVVEDDIEADLKALYAIRDAALQGRAAAQPDDEEPADFEPTRPGYEDSGKR